LTTGLIALLRHPTIKEHLIVEKGLSVDGDITAGSSLEGHGGVGSNRNNGFTKD
jgi:hypothetical protein